LGEAVAGRVSRDAVIVLPGIMGSELIDSRTGRVLWGLSDTRWYVQAWTSGRSLDALRVTDAERAGHTSRVAATRLLRFPAFAPILRGMEPYSALLAGVRQVTAHPDAVMEFAYDWRLSVRYNAALLAEAAEKHLVSWRSHRDGTRHAQLVLVAHSMGGLLARQFTQRLGGDRDVRMTITLGTPFHGSVQAAVILGSGRGIGLPLPSGRLRDLARSLPGLYDLLPGYDCVDDRGSARRLTSDDVAMIGGDRDFALQSLGAFRTVDNVRGDATLHTVVGVVQPTMQSLLLRDGTVDARAYLCEYAEGDERRLVDHSGDGTVYRDSAAGGLQATYLPQTHGALAKSPEAIAHVRAVITGFQPGPPMGTGGLGIDPPDLVRVGEQFDIAVSGVTDPAALSCRLVDAGTGAIAARLKLTLRAGRIIASAVLPEIGVYRMEFRAHGMSATSQLVMAVRGEVLEGRTDL
jgi:lecithin:cholesterol acyltransferase